MSADQPDPLNPSQKLYTYEESAKPFELPSKAGVHLEAITEHIKQHVGPTNGVFHEIISDQVHIDVIIVPPSDQFPEWTLVSSGMSDRPMKSPKDSSKQAYMELLIRLPKEWILPNQDGWKKEENFWPIKFLKFVARFPHKYGAFLWVGHTLDNGQPAKTWSPAIPFKAAFLAPSRTLPEAFENLQITPEKTIKFLALYPVYLEESALARREGSKALWQKFVEHTVTDIVDPNRPNLIASAPEAKKSSFWDRLRGK
ncbi:MAG TPA: suppressor of fused domain protein [Tepidisphaeraceae bacterium]|jgi:hypothetical protein|nr:suppressor of fused domain protein [Tepidisphaeraceae bacterium]